MPQPETWNVGRLLQWTTEYLAGRGADTARLDAEVLLAESLGCRRIDLYTRFDETPDEAVRGRFREMVRRRAEHVPVAYLVGRREFYSLDFHVTPDVLIPRPETELLVVAVLDLIKSRPEGTGVAICDVGTGSGAIAAAIASRSARAEVTAVDRSAAALAVARENARRLGLAERIAFFESDLLENLPSDARFDVVVSNPPYVSESEWAALAPEVRAHEPREALVGGPRGTEVIERLIPQAANRLKSAGHLLVEISPMIEQPARALFESCPEFGSVEVMKDLARLPRVVRGVRR